MWPSSWTKILRNKNCHFLVVCFQLPTLQPCRAAPAFLTGCPFGPFYKPWLLRLVLTFTYFMTSFSLSANHQLIESWSFHGAKQTNLPQYPVSVIVSTCNFYLWNPKSLYIFPWSRYYNFIGIPLSTMSGRKRKFNHYLIGSLPKLGSIKNNVRLSGMYLMTRCCPTVLDTDIP